MKKTRSLVYQFKIALDDVDPAVWRRIQVPGDYSFLDLHFAIQNAMGWQDSDLPPIVVPVLMLHQQADDVKQRGGLLPALGVGNPVRCGV